MQTFLLTRSINASRGKTFDSCVPTDGYSPASSYDGSANAHEENLSEEIDVYFTYNSIQYVRRYFRALAACQAAETQYDNANAPGNANPVPVVHVPNAPSPGSDWAQAYAQCVLGSIKAKQENDNDEMVQGMPLGVYERIVAMMPKLVMAQQENLRRIKELCRLRYPCGENDIPTSDYNNCVPKR
jgi:hypothetical protein